MDYCEDKPRCFLYHLDRDLYSECALSVSADGLAKIVRRALIGTGKFRTDRTTAVVAGQRGTLEECYVRAMRTMQRTDEGAHGLFHLLRVRNVVQFYTDQATIAALDEAIGHFVRVELLSHEAQLAEAWPGAEWFFHPDSEPPSDYFPPTYAPVGKAVAAIVARHLGAKVEELAVDVFNEHGESHWTRALSGTFVVKRKIAA